MKCSSCEFEGSETANFCEQCGSRLMLICSACGAEARPTAKFCPGCGCSFPPPTAPEEASSHLLPPTAEWRQLTVMFCDLVDSTSLSGQLEPENFRQVLKLYQSTCTEVIDRFKGHVAQYLGDGLLIYFGFPRATEESPLRAIRTGLGIVEALSRLNTDLQRDRGIRLAVRIGIHTGLVVVGEIGSGERQETLALGEAPNIAARIQSLAEPDTVVVSETTLNLVHNRFLCREISTPTLKGVKKPMPVFRALVENEVQNHLDATLKSGSADMVGRRQELELLLQCWDQTLEGHGQVVLLSGEAGIGKSRLTRVVQQEVTSVRSLRLEYRFSEYAQQSALQPVIQHLRNSWRLSTHLPASERLTKLETILGDYQSPMEVLVPLFADLLSIPLPENRYPAIKLSPRKQRQKTLEMLVACLLEESEKQPLLLVCEDLHWADPSSLDYLSELIVQVPTSRILLLLTSRPDFSPPWSSSRLTRLSLDRLSQSQVEELILILSGGKSLPDEIVQQVIHRADGVPLFAEELTRMVLSSDILHEMDDRYELAGPLPETAIPATLRDSLMARLDQLIPARELAQIAAVLGRELTYPLLRSVAPMNEATLRQTLAQLVEADLFLQRGTPPEARYMFKHALIHEAAYRSLLSSTRQRYHQKVADVLERKHAETVETEPELLAHHFGQAGLVDKAVEYWNRAGTKAAQRSENVEAISHLSRGLEFLAELPESDERTRQAMLLNLKLGEIWSLVHGESAPEVEGFYFQAWQICQEIGDEPELFQTLLGLFYFYYTQGESATAVDLAQQLMRLARRQQDPSSLCTAFFTRGIIDAGDGEFDTALRHFESGLASGNGEDLAISPSISIRTRAFSAWTLWLLGYPDRAQSRMQEALSQALQLQHPMTLAGAWAWTGTLHIFLGQPKRVLDAAQALTAAADVLESEVYTAVAKAFGGWAKAHIHRSEEGLAEISRGLEIWRTVSFEPMTPQFMELSADAFGLMSRYEEGLETLAEVEPLVEKSGCRMWQAELYRLRGALLTEVSSADPRAAECFERALAVARDQKARSLELRAAISLGQWWHGQGRCQEAREVLQPVHDFFTEGFATKDLREARALLDQFG